MPEKTVRWAGTRTEVQTKPRFIDKQKYLFFARNMAAFLVNTKYYTYIHTRGQSGSVGGNVLGLYRKVRGWNLGPGTCYPD